MHIVRDEDGSIMAIFDSKESMTRLLNTDLAESFDVDDREGFACEEPVPVKVLGMERFVNRIGQPGVAGESLGLLLPVGTNVKRGDVLAGA